MELIRIFSAKCWSPYLLMSELSGSCCLGQLGNAERGEVDVVVVIGVDVAVAVLVELHPNPERSKYQTGQRGTDLWTDENTRQTQNFKYLQPKVQSNKMGTTEQLVDSRQSCGTCLPH